MKNKRKKNPFIDSPFLYHSTYAILDGNPIHLCNALIYYKIGNNCKDCNSLYQYCSCEYCEECKFPQCLCDLEINNSIFISESLSNYEKDSIRKIAWSFAKKVLTEDQLRELRAAIFHTAHRTKVKNIQQILSLLS